MIASSKNRRKRSREDYYYMPIPIEIIHFFDELIKEGGGEGRKYGLDSRPKVIGAVLGDFIELYDKVGHVKGLRVVREMIRHADEYNELFKKKD